MPEHHLQVCRTARFFTLGECSEKTRFVWICCHGYGQLAQYFIRNFERLTTNGDTLIVAPEALSRFYLSGTEGRIGATWMTREARQHEITDYINYLDTLLTTITQQVPPDVKVFVLGFSQGVSTVCRWLAHSHFTFSGLVLWAGSFPPELAEKPDPHALLQVPVFVASGTNDPYIDKTKIDKQMQLLQKCGLLPALHFFTGKHELNAGLLQQFHDQLTTT